jgi:septin family protein
MNGLYEEISARTGGEVYIGVIGPVRTGKSTFIKRFMETMVLPNMENVYKRLRMNHALPKEDRLPVMKVGFRADDYDSRTQVCPRGCRRN